VCVVQIKVAKLLYSNVHVNCPTLPHHILVVHFLLDIFPISPALSATEKKKKKKRKKVKGDTKLRALDLVTEPAIFTPSGRKLKGRKTKSILLIVKNLDETRDIGSKALDIMRSAGVLET
jgi:hypothetical protein